MCNTKQVKLIFLCNTTTCSTIMTWFWENRIKARDICVTNRCLYKMRYGDDDGIGVIYSGDYIW